MSKKAVKLKAQVKVQIAGGKATPAPPVGTALGPHGINLGQFVLQFNEKTRDLNGMIVPVVVSIFDDRSFSFVLKSPPASVLLKHAAAIAKGATNAKTDIVGTVTASQVAEIVKNKMDDLNTRDHSEAFRMIAGTARSMGIRVLE
ncbi:MAG: 50S ribosomal protein L11 [Planctomycetota bacterium]